MDGTRMKLVFKALGLEEGRAYRDANNVLRGLYRVHDNTLEIYRDGQWWTSSILLNNLKNICFKVDKVPDKKYSLEEVVDFLKERGFTAAVIRSCLSGNCLTIFKDKGAANFSFSTDLSLLYGNGKPPLTDLAGQWEILSTRIPGNFSNEV